MTPLRSGRGPSDTLALTRGTDGRFYRPKGAVVYGAGIFSPTIDMADFGSRFHGSNERIDLESLRLVTDFWGRIIRGMDDHAAA